MTFPRDLLSRVLRASRHFPVVVLTGARQTGKTTLLRAAFPKHDYVTLDLPSEAAAAERDPDGFFQRHPPPVLVDEIQYAPSLFRHVKIEVDRDRKNGRFVLTGSQKLTLVRGVSESLAGRAAVLELEPLSVHELRTSPRATRALGDISATLTRGFMPALWADPKLPHDEFFASYVATYLERDLRQLVDVRDLRAFDRFLRICAARSTQLLSKADLARDVGVNVKTIDSWLSALEATGQIVLVPPFFANLGKRLVKSPKLFFCDTGLLSFLLGLDARTVLSGPLAGAVFETAVLAELRKALAVGTPGARVTFFRDHEGAEVDFVVEAGAVIDLVEAKWTELPDDRDARGVVRLASALEASGANVRRRLVACRTAAPFPLARGVEAVHLYDVADRIEPGRA